MANHDEDSITLSVAAALDCLGNSPREAIDGLYFASTTPPYREKLSAAVVAAACDLGSEVTAIDFSASLRAGTMALQAALDAVKAGSAKRVLVTAADCRLGVPRSDFEQSLGDAAAAVIVGDTDVAVNVVGHYSLTNEFTDYWRRDGDNFVRGWEDRFILTHGYSENVAKAVAAALQKYELTPKDFAKVVLYGPDPRTHAAAVRTLGFDLKSQVQDPLFTTVGNAGAAHALLMLVAALEDAKPGDRLMLVSYGDGAAVYILETTDQIARAKSRRGVKGYLPSKRMLPSYEQYVRYHQLIEGAAGASGPGSLPALWREHKQVFSLYGSKCTKCGTINYPVQRVCEKCQTLDQYEPVRLADRPARVFTYTKDFSGGMDPPDVVTIVEIEGGARFITTLTDRDPEAVALDMPLELTFRRVHDGAGFHNYHWRACPIR